MTPQRLPGFPGRAWAAQKEALGTPSLERGGDRSTEKACGRYRPRRSAPLRADSPRRGRSALLREVASARHSARALPLAERGTAARIVPAGARTAPGLRQHRHLGATPRQSPPCRCRRGAARQTPVQTAARSGSASGACSAVGQPQDAGPTRSAAAAASPLSCAHLDVEPGSRASFEC